MDDNSPLIKPARDFLDSDPQLPYPLSSVLEQVRARTPARILTGRTGPAYRTSTWLQLRSDHAAARDAVCAELDLSRDLGTPFVDKWGLFEVTTLAQTKQEFLLRPDLGRCLSTVAKAELAHRCPTGVDLQVAVADGLSVAAVQVQVPVLLPLLAAHAERLGWRFGQSFYIRHGRVGVLNDIGEILNPRVAVLLIGERPGLATAESLSAYMAYRPRVGHDDSLRNLISNIHSRGTFADLAADRIVQLAVQMIQHEASGIAVKERKSMIAQPAELTGNPNTET
jgi:ethanolamine ammonia-lyase small subunit